MSFEAGMQVFRMTKKFPREEIYSLTDQVRRSSRSVSGNIAEAWRKRRYPKSFIAMLNVAEGEAAETQTWLEYAWACEYISTDIFQELDKKYDQILGMLVKMIHKPQDWTL